MAKARFSDNPLIDQHMREMQNKQAGCTEIVMTSPKGSALAELRAIAQRYQDASPGLDFPTALAKATMNNPALYEKYLDERATA